MKEIFTILVVLLFAFPLQAGTLYKWVDKQGVVNFTDDLSKVPPSYRDRVKVEESKDEQEEVTPPPPQAVNRESEEEEITADIYGRDEAWWRDKVRPWKEQLKVATENYENAQKKLTKKTDELSATKFYGRSRSQTKWDIMELNRLNEEKTKYESQIAEANEMLGKLSKEAEESKANPDWLK
jgi:hypothetical protein